MRITTKRKKQRGGLDQREFEQMKMRRSLKERVLNTLTGGGIDDALHDRAASLAEAENRLHEITDRERDMIGFRSAAGSGTYDLSPPDQDHMISTVTYLWRSNGLAKRMIEDVKDAVVGQGIDYLRTGHKKTDQILEAFWWDKDNNWDVKGEERVRELGLFGELITTAYVSPQTGAVRLGYIDPSEVNNVAYDKDNKEEALIVKTKDKSDEAGKEYEVIRRDRTGAMGDRAAKEAKKLAEADGREFKEGEQGAQFVTNGRFVGDQSKVGTSEPVGVFYNPVNKLRNQTRGISDLWVPADYVDAYDRLVFDTADREAVAKTFIWDYTLEGATDAQCDAYRAGLERNPPKTAAFQVHNGKVKIEAVTPNIQAADTSVAAGLTLNMACIGGRAPTFLYSDGSKTNRAVGEELAKPWLMMLHQRQKYVQHIIETMIDFAIDQAVLAGYLTYESPEEEREVRAKTGVVMPEISTEDADKIASALAGITASLTSAVSSKWISNQDAAEAFALTLNRLGTDVSALTEDEAIEQQAKELEAAAKVGAILTTMLPQPQSPTPAPQPATPAAT